MSLLEKAHEAASEAYYAYNPTDTAEAYEATELAADAAMRALVTDLHAMLYPEQHPGYDPDHLYWGGVDLDVPPDQREPFQWSADTIEWVGEWVEGLRQELGTINEEQGGTE